MKENKTEDGRSSQVVNSHRWQAIETRLSVLWLAIRIVGAVVAAAAAISGVYAL